MEKKQPKHMSLSSKLKINLNYIPKHAKSTERNKQPFEYIMDMQ